MPAGRSPPAGQLGGTGFLRYSAAGHPPVAAPHDHCHIRPCGTHGPFCIDLVRQVFSNDGLPVHLPPKVFALLELLLRRQGRLVDRREILEIAWGGDHPGDPKTVDVHVKRLRRKLDPVPSRPQHLLTVRGRGYRLKA